MLKSTKDAKLYLRLLHYAASYWRMFALAISCMVILAATDPAVAALMQPMLDGAFIENDPEAMVLVPILFICLFAVRGLASYVGGASMLWVSNMVLTDLRREMFIRLLSFPIPYYDKHNSGKLMSKFTYDATQVRQAATNAITTLIRDSLAVIGLLAWMFYINWRLALIAMICAPFIALVILIIRKRLRKMSLKTQDSMGDIHHILNEVIDGQKLIKLFGGQAQEADRFNDAIQGYRRFEMKLVMAAAASSPVVQFIAVIVLAVIIFIASRQAAAGTLSVGEFVSFFGAMAMLLGPLKRLVRINEHIQRGLAACESIFSLLDEPIEIDSGVQDIKRINGDIEFRDVTFRYDGMDTNALSELSFHITSGQTVALVGSSGSGKTTIANLIPSFYEVSDGEVLIDGTNIQELTLASLRANIALVSQDVVLFNNTVRNNIAFGELRNCDESDVINAARSAYALEFIEQLPEGLNTIIGEKGLKLSGGQRQRLAIARALLKDAPILLLDEATSSLDTESERKIQMALEKVKRNRTCLIIAHRLTTVQNADRIIVIDQGRIVQTGRHEELLKQNGVYSKLHQVQFMEPDYDKVN